jgi:LacI family transcriptional regulator
LKVTMRDIAKYANVSLSTVSRALSGNGYIGEETRGLILKACEDLKYKPSYAINNMRMDNNIVGILTADLSNEFNVHIIEGVTNIADQNGFDVVIFDAQEREEKEERLAELLKKLPLKALVFTPVMDTQNINYKLIGTLENLKIPIVLVDRDLIYSNFDAVFLDNAAGASDAVNALINAGHRKIATIAGVESSLTGKDRVVGYRKALHMNGIEVKEEYIQDGKFTMEGGYQAMLRILDMEDPPTAVLVANVTMMNGCYKALEECGKRIPEDIAIISFDDLCAIKIRKELSTISQPMLEMGEAAMKILIERLRYPVQTHRETRHVILLPKLNLRGSERYCKSTG